MMHSGRVCQFDLASRRLSAPGIDAQTHAVESIAKHALCGAAMRLDPKPLTCALSGTHVTGPAKGYRQHTQQRLQPSAMTQARLFKIETSRFQKLRQAQPRRELQSFTVSCSVPKRDHTPDSTPRSSSCQRAVPCPLSTGADHKRGADRSGHKASKGGRLLKKLRAGAKTPVVRGTFMSCLIRISKGM